MSDEKISGLTLATSVPDTSEFVYEYNGIAFRISKANLKKEVTEVDLLHQDVAAVGTTAVITEETLFSYSIPANTLGVTGDWLDIYVFGSYAANGNGKQVRLKFGSYTFDGTVRTANARNWEIHARIYKQIGNNQTAFTRINETDPAAYTTVSNAQIGTPTEDMSTAITLSVTGQNAVASANDIIAEALTINHYRKPTT